MELSFGIQHYAGKVSYSSRNGQGESVHVTPKLLSDFCLLLSLPEHLATAPKLSQRCQSLKVAPGRQAISHRGGRPAAICSSPQGVSLEVTALQRENMV